MENGYQITTDQDEIDHKSIWRWLTEDSYWAKGRSWEVQAKAVENSKCFGVLAPDGSTAAFARVVTDGATFGWIADVVVLPEHRRRGLSKELMRAIVEDPELAPMRRMILGTMDAHSLYARFGFRPDQDGRFMERLGSA
jgi:predicted N-acetyltransferase YhbS